MSSTFLYTNPTLNKCLQDLGSKNIKCRYHIIFNILWNSFMTNSNTFIRSLTRYQPDINQSELDFRDSVIDIGKNLDSALHQNGLTSRISTRNEKVFSHFSNILRQDNLTSFNRTLSRFDTKRLPAGFLLTLLLQEHVTLVKRYIQNILQNNTSAAASVRQELSKNGENIIKLYLKVSKWKGTDIQKEGLQVWEKYLSGITDNVTEEVRKDYASSNRVLVRQQNESFCLADYLYKVIIGADAYSLMESACSNDHGAIEFTDEFDF